MSHVAKAWYGEGFETEGMARPMTGLGGIQHARPPVSTRRGFLATLAGAAASAYAETPNTDRVRCPEHANSLYKS